jgi:hypothetical protein
MQKYMDKFIKKHKSGFIIAMSGFVGYFRLIMREILNECPVLFFPCQVCPVTHEIIHR